MQTSALLTEELVRQAFGLVALSIDHLLNESGLANKSAMVVTVLDPFSGEVVASRIFGKLPREQWSSDYEAIALGKAKLAFQTGKDTSTVVFCEPHLLLMGDTKYQGGVYFHGIPIGASGVQAYIDEMVASWVGATCRMLCQRQMREVVEKDSRRFV